MATSLRAIGLLPLFAALLVGSCLAQDTATGAAVELRRIPAAEANQGVVADADHLYVIDNRAIGKYSRVTGARVDGWTGAPDGPFHHLNAGIVRDGRLYVAHSNYPDVPMVSSIEVWDTETMRHVDSHSFGIHSGSATWLDFRDGAWWVAFVDYDGRGGTPGRGVQWSRIERFDPEWRPTGAWAFPAGLVERFRPYSNSGGFWADDGRMMLTGHDAAEIYTVRLPAAGGELEWVGTIPAPIQGQGIGRDPGDDRWIFAIDRARREVIEVRLPPR